MPPKYCYPNTATTVKQEHSGMNQGEVERFERMTEGALLEKCLSEYRDQHPAEDSEAGIALVIGKSKKHIQNVKADLTNLSTLEWIEIDYAIGIDLHHMWYMVQVSKKSREHSK